MGRHRLRRFSVAGPEMVHELHDRLHAGVPARPYVLAADLQRPSNDEQQARSTLALSSQRGLAKVSCTFFRTHTSRASTGSQCAGGSARNLPHDVAGLGEGNQLHRALELLQRASGQDLENRHPVALVW